MSRIVNQQEKRALEGDYSSAMQPHGTMSGGNNSTKRRSQSAIEGLNLSGGRKRSGTVSASMPGKVVTVEVTVGDFVEEGQTILILEAMKMQNEVAAPISGTVNEVHCEDGMNVEANVPLVVITPPVQDEG